MSDKNQYNNLKFENQKLKTSAESKRDLWVRMSLKNDDRKTDFEQMSFEQKWGAVMNVRQEWKYCTSHSVTQGQKQGGEGVVLIKFIKIIFQTLLVQGCHSYTKYA